MVFNTIILQEKNSAVKLSPCDDALSQMRETPSPSCHTLVFYVMLMGVMCRNVWCVRVEQMIVTIVRMTKMMKNRVYQHQKQKWVGLVNCQKVCLSQIIYYILASPIHRVPPAQKASVASHTVDFVLKENRSL